MPLNISVVVTTYNRPDALRQVLYGLNRQVYDNFEVIVADDGSDESTREMLDKLKPDLKYSLQHVWQADEGFRASRSRNNAIVKATAEYIVMLDGDCVPRKGFLKRHAELAEHGWLVRGSRIMLDEYLTGMIERNAIDIHNSRYVDLVKLYLQGHMKRLLPLLALPLGPVRKLRGRKWQGVKTCNLGVWRKDVLAVNGFDESFVGWGHEDADFAVRLFNYGVRRKEGLYAVPVFHLWHKLSDRSMEDDNIKRLDKILESNNYWAEDGLDQH
jgi:glycosyltransferase involved in cell wall biosynthesis